MTDWEVPAQLVSIHDGDTITVVLDLGWRISYTSSIRLYGINAPELSTPDGVAARDYVRTLIAPGDQLTVVSHRLLGATEKYGRVLASVSIPGGRDLSTLMIDSGHAVPYMVS